MSDGKLITYEASNETSSRPRPAQLSLCAKQVWNAEVWDEAIAMLQANRAALEASLVGFAPSAAAVCAVAHGIAGRHDTPRSATASPDVARATGVPQYLAQSSISRHRFSNRSPRRYAASTALPTACARAISTTWFG